MESIFFSEVVGKLILIVHYIVCIFLIIVILLQAGKGADIGAAFGGTSQTVFGGRGAATFLSKITTAGAILFLLTSISLATISRAKSKSALSSVPDATSQLNFPKAVATPGATPQVQASPVVAPATPKANPAP